jgi:D-serine deaminase-like pyridoxal phosphate-dependent protein
MNIESIKRPSLVIDTLKVNGNIQKFIKKAKVNKVLFRPHFKTHQSERIGELFRKQGIDKIAVSSISMAKVFVKNAWSDITIAFPFNIREVRELKQLTKFVRINTLISAPEQIVVLKNISQFQTGFFIKIDTGMHRTGFEPFQIKEIEEILTIGKMNKKLIFKGFLSHFGHTYQAQNKEQVELIYKSSVSELQKLKKKFEKQYPTIIITIGDTPSCSILKDLKGTDEIRPGNFVYYDLMQMKLGSCTENEIAAIVACPVIDKNLNRNELLIYGGAVHLSKEYIIDSQGNKSFGSIVELNETGWSKSVRGTFLKSISQEHGIVQCNPEFLSKINVGDLIGILPVHSCLTAHLLKENTLFINT